MTSPLQSNAQLPNTFSNSRPLVENSVHMSAGAWCVALLQTIIIIGFVGRIAVNTHEGVARTNVMPFMFGSRTIINRVRSKVEHADLTPPNTCFTGTFLFLYSCHTFCSKDENITNSFSGWTQYMSAIFKPTPIVFFCENYTFWWMRTEQINYSNHTAPNDTLAHISKTGILVPYGFQDYLSGGSQGVPKGVPSPAWRLPRVLALTRRVAAAWVSTRNLGEGSITTIIFNGIVRHLEHFITYKPFVRITVQTGVLAIFRKI